MDWKICLIGTLPMPMSTNARCAASALGDLCMFTATTASMWWYTSGAAWLGNRFQYAVAAVLGSIGAAFIPVAGTAHSWLVWLPLMLTSLASFVAFAVDVRRLPAAPGRPPPAWWFYPAITVTGLLVIWNYLK
jgi:hypothetical protein